MGQPAVLTVPAMSMSMPAVGKRGGGSKRSQAGCARARDGRALEEALACRGCR